MRTRSVALAVAWRNLHNFFTNPALVVPALLFPLFFFTAFAGGLSGMSNAPGFDFPDGYTAFQFVFVLLQASAFGGVFTGFAIARDFEAGFGRRLMLAAPRRSAIVAGYALAALARAVFIWVMLTVIALAVGMQVGGGAVDLVGLYLLAALTCLAAVLWAAGHRAALPLAPGGPADADADLPDPLPGAGVRADRAAERLGRGGGPREPDHPDGRGRPRPDLGRVGRTCCWPTAAAWAWCCCSRVWAVGGLRRAEAAGG